MKFLIVVSELNLNYHQTSGSHTQQKYAYFFLLVTKLCGDNHLVVVFPEKVVGRLCQK